MTDQTIPQPKPAKDQSFPLTPERQEWHTPAPNSKFYVTLKADADAYYEATTGNSPSLPVPRHGNPYIGNGLLAVLTEITTSPEYRQKVQLALEAAVGVGVPYNHVINDNAQADPVWNVALGQVFDGTASVDAAMANVASLNPDFRADMLQAASDIANSYR